MVNTATPKRLHAYLTLYSVVYPGGWTAMDSFRLQKGHPVLGDWPEWCWLPLAGAASVVDFTASQMYQPWLTQTNGLTESLALDIGPLGALGTWRHSQGIYRFDPQLYAELIASPVRGTVPTAVLQRLPEYCVYLETPGLAFLGRPVTGAFAHLEHDMTTGRPELRYVLDFNEGDQIHQSRLLPLPIHLGGSLQEGLKAAVLHSAENSEVKGFFQKANLLRSVAAQGDLPLPIAEQLTSLLLYLCAEEADYDQPVPPTRASGTPGRGAGFPPPEKPTVWNVGARTGAALRKAYAHSGDQVSPADSIRRVRPHLRRGHWHGYWTGARGGAQVFKLRWVSPLLVGSPEIWSDLPEVVHPVPENGPVEPG